MTDTMHDMAALADVPPLPGGEEQPTTEIALFKLGRFRHAKFGTWNISREVFDSFLRNFQRQGRVPVDLDHSPERGQGTEAAGWITALKIVGNQLRARVEWTKIGADAIRERRFMFVSPTWSFEATDEHGGNVGPKLIGAGLTNRPHFQLPALNLSHASADQFGEMGVEMDEDECPCPQCGDREDESFDEHFALAAQHGIAEAHRDLYQHHWWSNQHLHDTVDGALKVIESGRALQRKWWAPIRAREAARTVHVAADLGDQIGPFEFSEPPGLDAEGERLHVEVVAYASEHLIDDYLTALAELTGNQAAASLQQRQEELPIDIPDLDVVRMMELDKRARAIARLEGVGPLEAAYLVELDDAIAEAEREDGYSETGWLDTSTDRRPRPWSGEDFERDVRRARTLDWELSKDEWLAGAETGRDVVFDEAVKRRADRIADLRYRRDRELADMKERQARRRKSAIEEELRRRAQRRLGLE
jgi:hypothetical protein